jgi:adenylylsulfate kinase-like enzyme
MDLEKKKYAKIFWCTGMSGAGKSTLATFAASELKKHNISVLILDGDVIRDRYSVPLGFNRKDVKKNNLHVAQICKAEGINYDVIIVPIISPIEKVRGIVGESLSPNFHLIYIFSEIESLRDRDTKGLYKKADDGEITDLIGYSKSNPYDDPLNFDLMINTTHQSEINESKNQFYQFIYQSLTL